MHRQLLPVISGCFRTICNRFSTLSAQLAFSGQFEELRAAICRVKTGATSKAQPEEDAAAYSRFSSENQDDKSIDDQIRECREGAARNNHAIPDCLHFKDEAVSGATVEREGLDDLRDKAALGRFKTLYVHSLSRLSRETTFCLPLLKELNSVHGIRIISVSEGIDSLHPLWYEFAVMVNLQQERHLKELSANTRRGLVGTVVSPYSCGDYVFGFTSVSSPDGATRRHAGIIVPRRVYAIDHPLAMWVVFIFTRYALEGRTLSWIADELNRVGVPKDHRSSVREWTAANVRSVLRNEKYVGKWIWGKTKRVRNPITGKISQKLRQASELSADWLREYPHLRVIDEELFEKAAARLDEAARQAAINRNPDGTLNGSSDGRPARHALQNLIRCSKCGRKFIRAGEKKNYLRCSGSLRKQCGVRTILRRDLASSMIREAVEARLLKNPAFLDALFLNTQQLWEQSVAQRPDELHAAEQDRTSVRQKISRIERQIEDDDDPPPNLLSRLKERNRELEQLDRQIALLEKSATTPQPPPTRIWVEQQLRERLLDDLMTGAPRDIEAFQGLFQKPIVVQECEIVGRKRKYFRASLSFCSEQLSGLLLGSAASGDSASVQEVVEIGIRPPRKSETQARLALSMWNDEASCDEIARALKVSRSRVTALFDYAEKELGLPKPDTRGRRPLSDIQLGIEKEVIARFQAGESLEAITKALGVSRPTVNRCLKRWHDQQGLPMLDGRARRKMLSEQRRSAATTDAAKSQDAGGSPDHQRSQIPEASIDSAQVAGVTSPNEAGSVA